MRSTPGPWIFEGPTSDGELVIHLDDSDGYTGNTCVAVTHNGKATHRSFGEKVANARLISAAPDLLEAAVAALAYITGTGEKFSHREETPVIWRLRQAIEKAYSEELRK